jgi:RNA polymerase sigma-70 factor (ECF subfamily)
VWLSLRRLGVAEAQLDDATQDVFVVVFRRLAEFEFRSRLKTWLFAIAIRVARAHRRRPRDERASVAPDELPAHTVLPHDRVVEQEALELVTRFLANLDEERRIVFIMAELEQIEMPEIAEVLGLKLNTAYSRLRLARADFQAQVARHMAREERGRP